MRSSFIFYESFYDAISDLNAQQRVAVYDAICKYALMGEEPDLKGLPLTIFKLIRPQLDANTKRYESGKKGGAPAGNQNAKKQPKNNHRLNLKTTDGYSVKQPNKNENENVNTECKLAASSTDADQGHDAWDYDFAEDVASQMLAEEKTDD